MGAVLPRLSLAWLFSVISSCVAGWVPSPLCISIPLHSHTVLSLGLIYIQYKAQILGLRLDQFCQIQHSWITQVNLTPETSPCPFLFNTQDPFSQRRELFWFLSPESNFLHWVVNAWKPIMYVLSLSLISEIRACFCECQWFLPLYRWAVFHCLGCWCLVSVSRVGLFWDPRDWDPPGSSVHGISQARLQEWVAFPSPGDFPDRETEPKCLHLPHCRQVLLPWRKPIVWIQTIILYSIL